MNEFMGKVGNYLDSLGQKKHSQVYTLKIDFLL